MSVRYLNHPAKPQGSGLFRTPGRAVTVRFEPSPLSSDTVWGPGSAPSETEYRLFTSSDYGPLLIVGPGPVVRVVRRSGWS
eukprot:205410-Amphidinium_carterae.1